MNATAARYRANNREALKVARELEVSVPIARALLRNLHPDLTAT
jgi:hypothetical protein